MPAPSSSASRGRTPAQGLNGGTDAVADRTDQIGESPSRTERTKSERTRERLLLAAATTPSRLGDAGMRPADVGEEAGVQAPAIYYYWPSREQLIEEVVTVGTIRLREYVAAALAAAPPEATALDRLDIAVDAHLRQLMSESAFAHVVIRNIGQLPAAIRSRQIVEERQYAAIWRELFADALASGELQLRSGPGPVPAADHRHPELGRRVVVTQAQLHRRGGRDRAVHHPARCRRCVSPGGRPSVPGQMANVIL